MTVNLVDWPLCIPVMICTRSHSLVFIHARYQAICEAARSMSVAYSRNHELFDREKGLDIGCHKPICVS